MVVRHDHDQGTTGPLNIAGPPPSDGNFCGGYAPHNCKKKNRILREFPTCYAYVDGSWFKTRNGLTERAEPMLLKLQCYWLNF